MTRLIHTGSVIVDQVMHIERMPESGGDIVASDSYAVAGGAMNSLLAAARDGMDVVYCGLVGTGPNASIIAQALEEAGIRENYERIASADNGYCVALVEDSAERTFITSIGVEGRFGYEHLKAIDVQPDDFVYVSGYSLATAENAEGLARWLPTLPQSVTVFVDPSPLVTELPAELFAPLLVRCNILSTNERESRAILASNGIDDADRLGADQVARLLAGLVPEGSWVVVRSGAEATRVCRNDGSTEVTVVPTFPQEAVDTNGCGDVHAGVLLAGLGRGLHMETAVKRANAAAAIKSTRIGPGTAPTTTEINEFLAYYRAQAPRE